MKKVVSVAVAAATLVGSAVADVSFGIWGRNNWVIGNQVDAKKGDCDEVAMGNVQSWGGASPRIGLNVSADAGVMGFSFDIHNNGYDQKQGDNAYVWVKPIEQVKLSFGKHDVSALRGDACFGLWDWVRIGTVSRKDPTDKVRELTEQKFVDTYKDQTTGLSFTGTYTAPTGAYTEKDVKNSDEYAAMMKTTLFTRTRGARAEMEGWTFMDTDKDGAIITVDPIENVTLLAAIGCGIDGKGTNLGTVLGRQSKFAAAYTIPETATIKLGVEEKGQTVKNKDGDIGAQNIINASVELTAVENLYFGFGAFIPTIMRSKDVPTGDVMQFNGYGRYKASDELTAHLRFGVVANEFDAKEDKDGQIGFLVGAGVDYAINETLSAMVHLEYANNIYQSASTADNCDSFTFGLGVKQSVGSGYIGVGFEGATNNGGSWNVYSSDAAKPNKGFAWMIPVTFQYSF